jgi:hypothetical protein
MSQAVVEPVVAAGLSQQRGNKERQPPRDATRSSS